MGYNIEVSFDILKNSSVTELQATVRNLAEECGCESFYEDYEYETNTQYKRNHCIMTVNFHDKNSQNLLHFLKTVRIKEGLFLELIYDEDTRTVLYASQYYVTQKMNKSNAKFFKKERRERSYSDDEHMILKTIRKS
jgi:hypothetical protein